VLKENPTRSPRFGIRGFVLLRFCNERRMSMILGNSELACPTFFNVFAAIVAGSQEAEIFPEPSA